jgi:hypothetical protein
VSTNRGEVQRYQANDKLKVLLYLHGHDQPPIDQHLTKINRKKDPDVYLLREELNASGKNLVLVAPTLGAKSEAGLLVTNGVDWYLKEVLDRLKKNAPPELKIGDSTAFSDLCVMAHSGGGVPLLALANAIPAGGTGTPIRQLWGFDCLYAPQGHHPAPYTDYGQMDPFDPEPKWVIWASAQQGVPMFLHWATDEPKIRMLNVEKLAGGWRPKAKQKVTLPAAGTLLNVTVIESQVKEHEPMVRPAMKIRLGALP